MPDSLPFQATGMVQGKRLKDRFNNVYLTSTNVSAMTGTLYAAKSDGTPDESAPIANAQNLAMSYVANSYGRWRAAIPANAGVTIGQRCWMLVTWTMTDGRVGKMWQDVVVVRQAA